MKTSELTATERAALEVLRQTGMDVLAAALLAREALERGRGRLKRARKCIELGAEQLELRERTVTFSKAVDEALSARRAKGLRNAASWISDIYA